MTLLIVDSYFMFHRARSGFDKGEFPVVYWGQSYMGTQESFFDAALIWMFGPGTLIIRL